MTKLMIIKMTIEKLIDHLELIKTDLKWQLSFEEIDWDHFGEFVKSAKVIHEKIEGLKLIEEGLKLIEICSDKEKSP